MYNKQKVKQHKVEVYDLFQKLHPVEKGAKSHLYLYQPSENGLKHQTLDCFQSIVIIDQPHNIEKYRRAESRLLATIQKEKETCKYHFIAGRIKHIWNSAAVVIVSALLILIIQMSSKKSPLMPSRANPTSMSPHKNSAFSDYSLNLQQQALLHSQQVIYSKERACIEEGSMLGEKFKP